MANLFKGGSPAWMPDADATNAPDGVLLRADNLVEDATGALALRAGSDRLYSDLEDQDVHSLYTAKLAGLQTYRFLGIDDQLYIDGVAAGATFDGSGGIAMGDDAYQAFFARGTTKKAFDGTTLRDWGVPKPIAVPTLSAATAVTSTVAAFNNTESPAVSAPEGSSAYTTDAGGTANEAVLLTPSARTSRGILQRLWTSDQEFLNIKGTQGTDNDQFDIMLNMAEPRDVEKIVVQFGLGDSSTVPFDTDRYEFTLDIKNGEVPDLKNLESSGYSAYEASVLKMLQAMDPTIDIGTLQTPEQVKTTLANVGSQPSPKSGGRPDPGTWSHLTITRGMFTRIGSTSGRSWSTVRGFRLVYYTRKGTVPTATFSDALWSGGGDLSLTGKFRACIRAGRDAGQYIELSPPSDPSEPITLNHQTLVITVPAAVLSALEGYADQLWIYLFGGLNLNTWYRFAVTSASPGSGMTIDELTSPAGSDFAEIEERARLASHGFTYSQLSGDGVPHVTGTQDIVVNIVKSEEQVLSEGLRMEPYQILPPDNIVGIAGPWAGRMFALTSDGSVYPSSNLSPSSFNSRQRLDLTRYGDPLWIARTTGGIYVGMTGDVVFLDGTGDDSEDLTFIDLSPRALGVGNPPVDAACVVEGSTIIYRAADGLVTFTGSGIQLIPFSGTELLWRGQDRHGVAHLNITTGRFRLAHDNGILYVLAPEGTETSSNVIYRLKSGGWRRFVFAGVASWRSLLTEPDGTLIAGDSEGNLWQLETGAQDDGNDIPVVLWTPSEGNALNYSDPMDLQLHVHTGGATGNVAVHIDGSDTAAEDFDFNTSAAQVYRIAAAAVGRFLRAQLRITGNFSTFILSAWNLSYNSRAQHHVLLDTGHFGAPDPQDMLWMSEAEIDCISGANLLLDLYLDDRLDAVRTGLTVAVTPNRRSNWRVPLPRGSKAHRPRIVVRAVADGIGHVGADIYRIRVKARGSGNAGDQHLVVYQAA